MEGRLVVGCWKLDWLLVFSQGFKTGVHLEEVNLKKFDLKDGIIYCQLVSKGFTIVENFLK